MILSKASLGVAAIAAVDKAIPALGNICICADGSAIALNSAVIVAVGPVENRVRDAVPLDKGPDGFLPSDQIILSADAARTIVKAMPRDTLFKGLLEHVSLARSGEQISAQVTDGKRKTNTLFNRASQRWVEWRSIFRRVLRAPVAGVVYVNRRRLENVLDTLRAVCPYSGEFSAVKITMGTDGSMSLRAVNEMTGQRVVIGFAGSTSASWPEDTTWEKGLRGGGAVRRPI